MKLFFSVLVLITSITCATPDAFASKNVDITQVHTISAAPAKETIESSNRSAVADEKSDVNKKDDKKSDTKKSKRYRGDNNTKRIVIIAVIAIAAIAIIIYVVASASVTKN